MKLQKKTKQKYPRKLKKQLAFESFEDGTKIPIMIRAKPYTKIPKRILLKIKNCFP